MKNNPNHPAALFAPWELLGPFRESVVQQIIHVVPVLPAHPVAWDLPRRRPLPQRLRGALQELRGLFLSQYEFVRLCGSDSRRLLVGDEPCLVQFTHQCQPEEATVGLPFLSIGSGQPVADPFLAFIRRIFWPDQAPSLNDGILAALWTVTHTIHAQPGGVASPIRIVTLTRDKNNKWKAEELSEGDLGEHQQMIELTEDEMRKVKDTFSDTEPTSPVPETPSTPP